MIVDAVIALFKVLIEVLHHCIIVCCISTVFNINVHVKPCQLKD